MQTRNSFKFICFCEKDTSFWLKIYWQVLFTCLLCLFTANQSGDVGVVMVLHCKTCVQGASHYTCQSQY